jgi:hypothetical protein
MAKIKINMKTTSDWKKQWAQAHIEACHRDMTKDPRPVKGSQSNNAIIKKENSQQSPQRSKQPAGVLCIEGVKHESSI